MDIEVAVSIEAILGEGPIWDAVRQCLYWVDILGHKLHIYDPKSGENRTIDVGQAVGTVVSRDSGGVILAMHHGFAALDLETEQLSPIADPERDLPTNRFNDGKCDPAGRLWAGTMDFDGRPGVGSLYCLGTDLTVTKKISPVSISNGIAWSLDAKTMYYIDTAANNVVAYAYDINTGDIQDPRIAVVNPGEGHLDGMTIDEEGMLWIAVASGGYIGRFDPDSGELLAKLTLPVNVVTSCAFGGEDLDDLYITSCRYGLNETALAEHPLTGSLLKIKMPIRGVPSFAFAG
jgi:sugar lactone lactonase YvrE